MVKIAFWTMDKWLRSQQGYYRAAGDYAAALGLYPDPRSGNLRRAPGWTGWMELPAASKFFSAWAYKDSEDWTYVFGRYNTSWYRLPILGNNYISDGDGGTSALTTGMGGIPGINAVYDGEHLYCIGADQKVYRGAGFYIDALFFGDNTLNCLCMANGDLYGLANDGTVYKSDGATFQVYYNPVLSSLPLYAAPYRGQLLIVSESNYQLHIAQLTLGSNSPNMRTETVVSGIPHVRGGVGHYKTMPFLLLNDTLYFVVVSFNRTAGREIMLYSWNGSKIGEVGRILNPDTDYSYAPVGLTQFRNRLVLYSLHVGNGLKTQTFYTIGGDGGGLVEFATLTAECNTSQNVRLIAGVRDAIFFQCENGSNATGLRILDYPNLLPAPYVISSAFDAGLPTQPKRLHALTALLNVASPNVTATLSYQVDDAAVWTAAGSANNSRRVYAGDLAADFYSLRVKLEIADAGNTDVEIQCLEAQYSVDAA